LGDDVRRVEGGQWAPGQSGNPGGRPKGIAAYRRKCLDAIRDVADEDAWRLIILRAVEDAKNGDRHARRWLSDYSLGAPIQQPTEDGDAPITLDEWIVRAEVRLKQAEE